MNDMISFFKQNISVISKLVNYFLGVGSVQKSVFWRDFGCSEHMAVKFHRSNVPVGTPLVSVPKRLPFGYKKTRGHVDSKRWDGEGLRIKNDMRGETIRIDPPKRKKKGKLFRVKPMSPLKTRSVFGPSKTSPIAADFAGRAYAFVVNGGTSANWRKKIKHAGIAGKPAEFTKALWFRIRVSSFPKWHVKWRNNTLKGYLPWN